MDVTRFDWNVALFIYTMKPFGQSSNVLFGGCRLDSGCVESALIWCERARQYGRYLGVNVAYKCPS